MFAAINRLKKDIASRYNRQGLNEVIARLKDNTPSIPAYICQFCGKKTTTPHGGICRFSPYKNKTHKFIKAGIEWFTQDFNKNSLK